jgi:hypothetical protein
VDIQVELAFLKERKRRHLMGTQRRLLTKRKAGQRGQPHTAAAHQGKHAAHLLPSCLPSAPQLLKVKDSWNAGAASCGDGVEQGDGNGGAAALPFLV